MPVVTRSQSKKAQINVVLEHKDAGFPDFRKLPAEIRLMIWKFAADEPRVLDLVEHPKYPTLPLEEPEARLITKCPSILVVCRESRLVGLETYITFFRSITSQPNAYFNPRQDEIFLSTKIHLQWFLRELRMACDDLIVNMDGELAFIDFDRAWPEICRSGDPDDDDHYECNIDGSCFLLRVREFDEKPSVGRLLAKLVIDCDILDPQD